METTLNRLSDICLPPEYRLANEECFFNRTKDIRLAPFRKQEVYENCISPDRCDNQFKRRVDDGNDELEATGEICKVREAHTVFVKDASVSQMELGTNSGASRVKQIDKICKSIYLKSNSIQVNKYLNNSRLPSNHPKTKNSTEWQMANVEKSFKRSNKLNDDYDNSFKLSKIYILPEHQNRSEKLRHSKKQGSFVVNVNNNDINNNHVNNGKDNDYYPYSNPMPEFILSSEKKDQNLRDILTVANEIEWTMLTPVKANCDYDENYLNRLISLHRERHKSRQEIGFYQGKQIVPFQHTRHFSSVQYIGGLAKDKPPTIDSNCSPFSLDLKLKYKFHLRRSGGKSPNRHNKGKTSSTKAASLRDRAKRLGGDTKLELPKLTLTSAEMSASELIDCATSSNESSSGNQFELIDLPNKSQEFHYETFSRHSLRAYQAGKKNKGEVVDRFPMFAQLKGQKFETFHLEQEEAGAEAEADEPMQRARGEGESFQCQLDEILQNFFLT